MKQTSRQEGNTCEELASLGLQAEAAVPHKVVNRETIEPWVFSSLS
jgi:hypothetical protein